MTCPPMDKVWTNFGLGQTLDKYEILGLLGQFVIKWTDSAQSFDLDKQWTNLRLRMISKLVDKLWTKFGLGQKLDKVLTSLWPTAHPLPTYGPLPSYSPLPAGGPEHNHFSFTANSAALGGPYVGRRWARGTPELNHFCSWLIVQTLKFSSATCGPIWLKFSVVHG